MRSITLTRSAQLPTVVNGLSGFHVIITASAAVNMPNEVFVKRERPLDPIAQTVTSDFFNVATPTDIQNLPINAPIPPDVLFRVLQIDVFYVNETEGDNAWTNIQAGVQLLIDSLDAADLLNQVDVVVITS